MPSSQREESSMRLPIQGFVAAMGTRAGVPFAIVTPDGTVYRAGAAEPAFRIVFRTEAALLATFLRGHSGLLESYFDQAVDVRATSALPLLPAWPAVLTCSSRP